MDLLHMIQPEKAIEILKQIYQLLGFCDDVDIQHVLNEIAEIKIRSDHVFEFVLGLKRALKEKGLGLGKII